MKNAQAPKKTSGKPKPKALALQLVQQAEPEGRRSFKKYIWSTISSGAALLLGDYLSRGLSQYFTGSEEYNFVFKFLLGATVLGYSASHRIIDKTFSSLTALSAAIGSEVMAITFTYSSVFNGTQFLLGDRVSNEYSLIAGLGTSAIIAPSAIAYLAQKLQVALVRRDYGRGAQRSDTAAISCGLTPLSTWYFQFYSTIAPELLVSSRAFQLGVIAHNIRHDAKFVRKFRHLPALFADLAPSSLRKLQEQQRKLEFDYEYNNTLYRVLRFTNDGKTEWVFVPSYLLRTGDLVYCDERVDLNRVPVSGELVVLERDEQRNFVQKIERRKFSVNLKAHNGEDEWIEQQSKADLTSRYPKVDMHAVKNKKQPGVLVGDKLNLRGCDRFFIQIKPEKELLMSHYEKTAVINDIITNRKKINVLYSILGSVTMAALLKRDLNLIPAETLTQMFTMFQAFIPFSEAFLRDAVNGRLLKKLNADLGDHPLARINALRLVDFCNDLDGYYRELFPKGTVLLSDKTGTLTLTRMDVLGLWVPEMGADIQKALVGQKGLLLPTEKEWLDAFEVFCSAYTNEQNEREENAILDQFKILLGNPKCLEVLVTHSSNHFTKVITGKGIKKEIETFHIGLHSHFGGRFTLVQEGKEYYLVFCGVPNTRGFKDTHVLQDYNKMQTRTGVLSRDWCVARARLNEQEFLGLKKCFDEGSNKKEIQELIAKNTELLQRFSYYGTFIIDNPIKKGAEKFINKCKKVSVPVFVVTGDNTKAAANIAQTLCPENAKNTIPKNGEDLASYPLEFFNEDRCPADSTIIFSGQKGLTPALLQRFQKLMDRKADRRPVIIFAEMSTEGKGLLAQYLSKQGYFVVASGDDRNDTKMMEHSNMVITHPDENGVFGPGVKELSDISAEQVRRLFRSNKTFYELFDIDEPTSLFKRIFAPLADSQEKALVTSALKIGPRMSLDMARAVGFRVKEMNHQHWYTMAFDMMWLWISYYEINQSADLPMNSRNINISRLMNNTMAISLVYGVFQALVNYVLYDESTNLNSMILMLTFLPLVLKSIFSGFRAVQDSLYPQVEVEEVEDRAPVERDSSVFNRRGLFFSPGTKQLEAPKAMPSPS